MLEQRASVSELGAADQLPPGDHDLAAGGLRRSRRRRPAPMAARRGARAADDAEASQRVPQHPVDLGVGARSRRRLGRGRHSVGELLGVPHGPAAGRPPHRVEAPSLDPFRS